MFPFHPLNQQKLRFYFDDKSVNDEVLNVNIFLE
jgi:hypothetical protein